MTDWLKGHWQLLALTALIFALWQTPVVLPLKILIVFFHELSHGLAAVLTGGEIVEISLSPQQGGLTVTRGGSRFVTLSAGYLGSLLVGVGLLLVALRTQADRIVMAICGAVLLGVAIVYVRSLFALIFCFGTGFSLLAVARFLHPRANDLVLRVIGLSSLIYVPYDIFDDTIARSGLPSDARMLAELTWLPTVFWGTLWLVLSLAVILWCLRYGIGRDSNLGRRA